MSSIHRNSEKPEKETQVPEAPESGISQGPGLSEATSPCSLVRVGWPKSSPPCDSVPGAISGVFIVLKDSSRKASMTHSALAAPPHWLTPSSSVCQEILSPCTPGASISALAKMVLIETSPFRNPEYASCSLGRATDRSKLRTALGLLSWSWFSPTARVGI